MTPDTFSTEYMDFVRQPSLEKKTRIYCVYTKRGDILGFIKWYGPWRQYTFHPSADTIFNKGCLFDIESFLVRLMNDRKKARAA